MSCIYIFWSISTITVLLLFVFNIFRWVIYIKENKDETFYVYDFIYTFTQTNKELKKYIKYPIKRYNFKNEVMLNVMYIFTMLLPIVGIVGFVLTVAAIFKTIIETILNFKIKNSK